jgi:hypothetical protein
MLPKSRKISSALKEHPDLLLAQRAKEAHQKNLQTNRLVYLRQSISLWKAAAKEAERNNHPGAAIKFNSEAKRLDSILKTFHTKK